MAARTVLRIVSLAIVFALGLSLGTLAGYRWHAYVVSVPPMMDMMMELTIEDVTDGDTVRVRYGEKLVTVRLMGIDTPETVDPRKRKQCFGENASMKTKALLGKTVKFEFIPPSLPAVKRDRYDRPLAYIHLPDGKLWNEELLREGYAHQYTFRGDYKYRSRFVAAQKDAQERAVGMWSSSQCAVQSERAR